MESFTNLSAQFPLYKQQGTAPTSQGLFLGFAIVSLAVWFFDLWISIRQHRRYSDTEVDPGLLELVDKLPPIQQTKATEKNTQGDSTNDEAGQESSTCTTEEQQETETFVTYKEKILAKFPKSQAYAKDKSSFGFFKSAFDLVLNFTYLFLGFSPFMWDQAEQTMSNFIPSEYHSDTTQTCIFVCLTSLVQLPLSLPFSIYSTFVVEERHGFNKTTCFTFVKDLLLGMVLQVVFGLPILAIILTIIEMSGPFFFVYVSVAIMALTFFMMTIYPNVIAPLFNDFDPLKDGTLKEKIEGLAASLNFPLKKLFVVDGSKRSSHSNAYMYGFCKSKRIVLYDTLIKQCTEDEIVAILGHELGHWKMGHTVKNMILSQAQIFLTFYALSFFVGNETMFNTFGFAATPTFVGLSLFLDLAFTPLNPFLQFLMSYITRLYEFQADAHAAKLGHSKNLQVGLVKLQLENLGALAVDPLYSAYHYSHPPVVERLRALTAFQDKEK
jgi:STE24 endopeptidase